MEDRDGIGEWRQEAAKDGEQSERERDGTMGVVVVVVVVSLVLFRGRTRRDQMSVARRMWRRLRRRPRRVPTSHPER